MRISNRPRCRSHALKNAYTTRRRGAGRGLGQPMPNWMMVLPCVTSGGVTSEVELVVDACMMPETDDIRFFRPSDRYGFLSNFYYSDFTVDGKHYRSAEHYFQSKKFAHDENQSELVRLAKTPYEALKMGRNRAIKIDPDWDKNRISVMKTAVFHKFLYSPQLRNHLLATYPRNIFEVNPNDYFWSLGLKGNGRNMLGQILMEVRDEIKELQ